MCSATLERRYAIPALDLSLRAYRLVTNQVNHEVNRRGLRNDRVGNFLPELLKERGAGNRMAWRARHQRITSRSWFDGRLDTPQGLPMEATKIGRSSLQFAAPGDGEQPRSRVSL